MLAYVGEATISRLVQVQCAWHVPPAPIRAVSDVLSRTPMSATATGLRDFTINSLLYDPVADEVLDYVGAVPDIQNRVS